MYISEQVMLFVRMGRDLTIPKYQPTNPTLEREDVVDEADDDEEKNKDGEISYSLVFLTKSGNRKYGLECVWLQKVSTFIGSVKWLIKCL